jgi:hypothetical protein
MAASLPLMLRLRWLACAWRRRALDSVLGGGEQEEGRGVAEGECRRQRCECEGAEHCLCHGCGMGWRASMRGVELRGRRWHSSEIRTMRCLSPQNAKAMSGAMTPPGILTCMRSRNKESPTQHSLSLILSNTQFARWLRPSSGRSLTYHCHCGRLA